MAKVHDLIIIGGGPAGLTAGLYAARGRLDTIMLERGLIGGQQAITEQIDNYPGFPEGITGPELSMRMHEQAERFGLVTEYAEVEALEVNDKIKKVITTTGEYLTKTILIATGSQPRKLQVPGEEEFAGRGVSYCATCDGAFFRGQPLVVVGGGDSAVEEGLYLTRLASHVTVIHRRDELRAQKILQEKAFATENMSFIWDTVVTEIAGDGKVNRVLTKNVKTGETKELETAGAFIYVGLTPLTQYLPQEIELHDGYVLTNEALATNVPGVFAAGDVRHKSLRQIATAVGEGALAIHSVEQYLQRLQ